MISTGEGSPWVTVLMTCYNAARWLPESIESVLGQSFQDFECVIIDDGSTDQTWEIIGRYEKRDSRIRPIRKQNTGPADSRNAGLRIARGRWIAVLDADDVCEERRLETQMDFVARHPEVVLLGAGMTSIDESGSVLKTYRYPAGHTALLEHLTSLRRFPPHSSIVYRTDAVRSVGGFRSRMRRVEDYDLWLRLSEVGSLGCVLAPQVKIRLHPDQISHDDGGRRQMIYAHVAAASYHLRQWGQPDPIDADLEAFNCFYDWVAQQLEQQGLFAAHALERRYLGPGGVAKTHASRMVQAVTSALRDPRWMLRRCQYLWRGSDLPVRLAAAWVGQPVGGRPSREGISS